jgi:hypothetical protein
MSAVAGPPAPMTVPVLLGMAAGVMVGLLFYALLVTEPPVAYIVGVLAAAAVTGWAALECLLCDWADRSGDGHPVRRPPAVAIGEARRAGGWTGWTGPRARPTRPSHRLASTGLIVFLQTPTDSIMDAKPLPPSRCPWCSTC